MLVMLQRVLFLLSGPLLERGLFSVALTVVLEFPQLEGKKQQRNPWRFRNGLKP